MNFRSTDPQLAADVPNAIAAAFVQHKSAVSKTEAHSTINFLVDQVASYERELAAASEAGVVRPGDFHRDALNVFELVLSNINEVVLGSDDVSPGDAARYVWEFCWAGLSSEASAR